MLKETVIAVSVVTMAAGAALAPSAVDAKQCPLVVADSHEDPCNPCNPCAGCNPCNPCGGCNPCNPCATG